MLVKLRQNDMSSFFVAMQSSYMTYLAVRLGYSMSWQRHTEMLMYEGNKIWLATNYQTIHEKHQCLLAGCHYPNIITYRQAGKGHGRPEYYHHYKSIIITLSN